jgi:hypothetical protein
MGEREQTTADEIRERRILGARRAPWTELEETRLVERSSFYVDAETDRLYTPHRGALFGDGKLLFDESRADLVYVVTEAGGILVFEPATIAPTWSEHLYARERRAAAGAR